MEVDARLYEIMKENETGLHMDRNRNVVAYIHLSFYDIKEFVDCVGSGHFDEGGLEVRLFKDSLCVEINDIIESNGHNLSSYKKCFDEDTWDQLEWRILEIEAE